MIVKSQPRFHGLSDTNNISFKMIVAKQNVTDVKSLLNIDLLRQKQILLVM